MASGASMSYHTATSSRRVEAMRPVPSMWPDTICPPKRPLAGMARSRFTVLPALSAPSDDRRSVSCITSAQKPTSSTRVAVRHTPLVAMLSPMRTPCIIAGASMESTELAAPRLMERTRPTVSTSPVNMGSPSARRLRFRRHVRLSYSQAWRFRRLRCHLR